MARRRRPRSVEHRRGPKASCAGSPVGQRRLDEALDDRRPHDEGVEVQAERQRLARERVDAEQDALADAQRVDGGRQRPESASRSSRSCRPRRSAAGGRSAARRSAASSASRPRFRSSGTIGAVAGEVDADAGEVDVLEPLDGVDERRQVGGHHALAQVAELDHGDDPVPAALPRRRPGPAPDRLELALQRDVAEAHDVVGELRAPAPAAARWAP